MSNESLLIDIKNLKENSNILVKENNETVTKYRNTKIEDDKKLNELSLKLKNQINENQLLENNNKKLVNENKNSISINIELRDKIIDLNKNLISNKHNSTNNKTKITELKSECDKLKLDNFKLERDNKKLKEENKDIGINHINEQLNDELKKTKTSISEKIKENKKLKDN